MEKGKLYQDWLGAFAAIDMPAISRDTAARILAVLYVHGNNEAMTHNTKFLQEIKHIQAVYKVDGGEIPDAELVTLVNKYIKELETYREQYKDDTSNSEAVFHNHAPEWANKLYAERYGIKLIN